MAQKSLGIGLIGSGFIARCHVFGYRQMPIAFPAVGAIPRLEIVSDITTELAERAAGQFGFARSTTDWKKVVTDPKVDIVDICVPSQLHKEIALAAIAAGKTVYCEKPVGLSGAQAKEIADAAPRGKGEKPYRLHLSAQSADGTRAKNRRRRHASAMSSAFRAITMRII